MGNTRGMLSGLGQALSTVGTIGLNEQFERDKEARLEKIRLDAEARAETRGLAAEGRERQYAGEDRAMRNEDAIAAEGRAAEQAGKDRAAQHANRLDELRTASRLTKEEHAEKLRLEKEAAKGQKFVQKEIPGTDEKAGGVLFTNQEDPSKSFYFDGNDMQVKPVGASADVAKPQIPQDILDNAGRIARDQVDEMDSMWAGKEDKDRLRALGGREAAIATLTNEHIGTSLRNGGYNPADFGYTEAPGLLTKAEQGPKSPPAGGRPMDVGGAKPPAAGNKAPPAAPVIIPVKGKSDPEFTKFSEAYNRAVSAGRQDVAAQIVERAKAGGVIRTE